MSQHCRGIIDVNGGLAIGIQKEGALRVLEIDSAGFERGLRQVNSPDKLSRI